MWGVFMGVVFRLYLVRRIVFHSFGFAFFAGFSCFGFLRRLWDFRAVVISLVFLRKMVVL